MKKCPACHQINSSGELFCLTCGAAGLDPVSEELPFGPNIGQIKGEEMKAYIGGLCVGTMKRLSSKSDIGFKSCEKEK